jgi:penicillin-binding protein 1A
VAPDAKKATITLSVAGRPRRRLKRFSSLRILALLFIYLLFGGAGGAYLVYTEFAKQLPDRLDRILDYQPERATIVYSADGEKIGEFYLEKRERVPLSRIPRHVQDAFIAAEDRRFRTHHGFDPIGIGRAAWSNYVKGEHAQGASTITQQVTRMLMLTQDRTFARKIKELILSVRVERELTKDQILYIYLNHVYLGHGAYGVQAAAENYFGKDVEHLTIAEAAILAGLPKAPTKFSPYVDFHRARERQAYVLAGMRELGFITKEEEEAAKVEPIALLSREAPLNSIAAPYFVDFVRKWAIDTYGDRNVLDAGLRIYTTIDMKKQRAAEASVQKGLVDLDRRLGWRGPVGHLAAAEAQAFADGPPRPYVTDPNAAKLYAGGALLPDVPYTGVVTKLDPDRKKVEVDVGPQAVPLIDEDAARAIRWRSEKGARLAMGDLIPITIVHDEKKGDQGRIVQVPDVEAALVSMDYASGDVLAMVGGYDYQRSVFNRAVQARRQAGSSFKPFIYATAMQHGFTELSVLEDAPIAIKTPSGIWAPHNYEPTYLGPLTLKTALARSINTISVRLVAAIGVDPVIKTMHALGITTDAPRSVTISVGTPDVKLYDMVAAYGAFPSGGKKVEPRFVTLVTSDDGTVVEDDRAPKQRPQVLPPDVAYLMVDLMKGVVQKGTGQGAKALGRPAAGKTGTSTGFRDAWFIAYTTDMIAGVWVGRDNFKPIGYDATGGMTALPIWLDYMRVAEGDLPARDFPAPPGVTFVRANDATGEPAPAGADWASWVPFLSGTVPREFTTSVSADRFSTGTGFPQ